MIYQIKTFSTDREEEISSTEARVNKFLAEINDPPVSVKHRVSGNRYVRFTWTVVYLLHEKE